MAKTSLTLKQAAVFEFIQRYVAENHQSPLIREIQAGCQIASYKSALDRLNAVGLVTYWTQKPGDRLTRGFITIRKPTRRP